MWRRTNIFVDFCVIVVLILLLEAEKAKKSVVLLLNLVSMINNFHNKTINVFMRTRSVGSKEKISRKQYFVSAEFFLLHVKVQSGFPTQIEVWELLMLSKTLLGFF